MTTGEMENKVSGLVDESSFSSHTVSTWVLIASNLQLAHVSFVILN